MYCTVFYQYKYSYMPLMPKNHIYSYTTMITSVDHSEKLCSVPLSQTGFCLSNLFTS